MDIKLKIKNWLEWLRGLSDTKKKIILWTIVAIAAAIMGYFWVKSAINNFKKINESVRQIELPNVKQNLNK